MTDWRLTRGSFNQLPHWGQDDPRPLFGGLRALHRHVTTTKPFRTGATGFSTQDLMPLLEASLAAKPQTAAEARRFFEDHCVVLAIETRAQAEDWQQDGLITGFYEPVVEVSDRPDAEHRFAFYRRPPELVELDDANRPERLDSSYRFGWKTGERIDVAPDRLAIEQGYLDGRGLEIAWARSKVDVFFAHIQGAARLKFGDGRWVRITFDGKTGHPFTAIGRTLIDRGELDLATVSMRTIRGWLADHPDRADFLMWQNRSFIFFREQAVEDENLGPIAAAKIPLIPERSIAVDRLIHSFGYPFYVSIPQLAHIDGPQGFHHLMLALDTGTAIVGAARGDLFTGSGDLAGEKAGSIRHAARFFLMAPKEAADRLCPSEPGAEGERP